MKLWVIVRKIRELSERDCLDIRGRNPYFLFEKDEKSDARTEKTTSTSAFRA